MNKSYRPTYNIIFAIVGLLLATSGFLLDGTTAYKIAGLILLTGDSNDKAAAAGLIAASMVVLLMTFFKQREIANSK